MTRILGRIVSIRVTPSGHYEIFMQGRGGFEVDPRTPHTFADAKAEAHAFVHETLQRGCDCGELLWLVVAEPEPSSVMPQECAGPSAALADPTAEIA